MKKKDIKKNRFKLYNFKLSKFKLIDSISSMVGSWWFLISHLVWFVLWLYFSLNINLLIIDSKRSVCHEEYKYKSRCTEKIF